MSNEIQDLLIPLANKKNLTREQAARIFQIIMHGGATPAQMGAILMGLRQKGETVEEITGAALALRAKCLKLQAPENAIDTCGTGGDHKGTLNVSTAAALVVAACGVPVAKHGNRSITSASGSADVLRELGVNIDADISVLEKSLRECNICFMMAPRFHTAMRHIAPVRSELGLRTIFNVLGPLINPAFIKRQLLGVYSQDLLTPMAEVLGNLGLTHAWVVHGSDGMDELTLAGPTYVAELREGVINEFEVTPEEVGLISIGSDALKGQDAAYNAQRLTALLAGERGPYRDIVAFNAAACLMIADKVDDMQEGVEMAQDALDSGKARETLAQLVHVTN